MACEIVRSSNHLHLWRLNLPSILLGICMKAVTTNQGRDIHILNRIHALGKPHCNQIALEHNGLLSEEPISASGEAYLRADKLINWRYSIWRKSLLLIGM